MNKKNDISGRIIRVAAVGVAYLIVFFFLEKRHSDVYILHTPIDDMIPFCKYFIIPYVFWYIYFGGTILHFILTDEKYTEYYRYLRCLLAGIIAFVFTSLIFPNGVDLRPVITGNDIFDIAVKTLYSLDTPTNVLPSLHVYVSLATTAALWRSKLVGGKTIGKLIIGTECALIIASTMLLKQHSVIDVTAGIILYIVVYNVVYRKHAGLWEKLVEEAQSNGLRF